MKKTIFFIAVLITLTGCQWQEKRAIKKMIADHYTTDMCIDWDVSWEKNGNDVLVAAGLLNKKIDRSPEGIMGYALQQKYVLSDFARTIQKSDGSLCYGIYRVEEFKDITFEKEDQAIVSFVIGVHDIQEWAHALSLEEGKQLHRVTIQKLSDQQWQIINK